MSVKFNTKFFIILIVLAIEYLSLIVDISNPQIRNIISSTNPKDSIVYNNTLNKLTSLVGYQDEHSIYNPNPLNLMLKNTKNNCAEEVLSSK